MGGGGGVNLETPDPSLLFNILGPPLSTGVQFLEANMKGNHHYNLIKHF